MAFPSNFFELLHDFQVRVYVSFEASYVDRITITGSVELDLERFLSMMQNIEDIKWETTNATTNSGYEIQVIPNRSTSVDNFFHKISFVARSNGWKEFSCVPYGPQGTGLFCGYEKTIQIKDL